MSISEKELTYIAGLAKIGMTEHDVQLFTKELNGILHWMEALNQIQVPDNLPTYIPQHVMSERPDDHPTDDISAQLMTNAPDPQHNFFAVPKVIE